MKNQLSKREIEIVTELSNGLTAEGAAKKLFISTRTVHAHVDNIKVKLRAKNLTHAVSICYKREILDLSMKYDDLTNDQREQVLFAGSDQKIVLTDIARAFNDREIEVEFKS